MKAVLLSIQPKWCELIASGKKTVEVRKSKPKLQTPFKCYIYETQSRTETPFVDEEGHYIFKGRGQVIGEFVCGRISEYECSSDGFGELATTCGTCLTYDEILNYCNGNELYGWHIADLKIYDEPRELSEFYYPPEKYCEKELCGLCPKYEVPSYEYGEVDFDCEWKRPISRPPQSWMFVEEQR